MSDQQLETNDSSVNSTANNRKQYYCHHCNNHIEPLFAPGLTCPRCNSDFVEEVEENSDLREFVEHGGGGQDTDDDYDDIQIPLPENPPNGLNEILQLIQNMINGPLRVQTESRDGTTTTTITATGTRTTTSTTENADQQNDGLHQQQPNIIFMDASAQNTGDNRTSPPFNLARMFRALESGTNAVNFMNILNIAGDPGDYAWGNTGWDNIISQLMEQQAGRQAPPPATDEIIANLPKTKITKKQVAEEQLGCPVCKDEFKIDEEAVYLPCTHTFHYDCIQPWLKMNGTCPVCRYSLVNQDNNEQNHNGQNRNNSAGSSGNNNNNFGSSTSMFRFSFNSSLPGTYPGNQQNNEQQNHQGETYDADLDHEPVD